MGGGGGAGPVGWRGDGRKKGRRPPVDAGGVAAVGLRRGLNRERTAPIPRPPASSRGGRAAGNAADTRPPPGPPRGVAPPPGVTARSTSRPPYHAPVCKPSPTAPFPRNTSIDTSHAPARGYASPVPTAGERETRRLRTAVAAAAPRRTSPRRTPPGSSRHPAQKNESHPRRHPFPCGCRDAAKGRGRRAGRKKKLDEGQS